MNSIVNHRSVIVSIVVALLCIALFVGALLLHESMHGTHLVTHGIMLIQAHKQVV
ncbi:MAG TPA: hypothetical protein VKB35_10080 [Ktedonobacteraceae bacterium]|nr:hypothetical protein [Ktedonobacteraceae bacterium]